MSCPRLEQIEHWAREGSETPLPADLGEHVEGCVICADRSREIAEPRRWLASLPVHHIDERRRSEIRFALMSAVRRSAAPADGGSPSRRRAWTVVAALAVTAAAAAAVLVLTWPGAPSPASPSAAPRTHAVVRGEEGADLRQVRPAPDELYRLSDGSAWFRVARLERDERFVVRAGDAMVEVRGTRFHLDVDDGKLATAQVTAGRVRARFDDGRVVDLRAGQRWDRPPSLPADRMATVAPDVSTNSGAENRVADLPPHAPGVREPLAIATTGHDRAFRNAWQMLRAGRVVEAAAALDQLAAEPGLEPERRSEVLYWAAQAHLRAGHTEAARARALRAIEAAPRGWHAGDATRLLERVGAPPDRPADARQR